MFQNWKKILLLAIPSIVSFASMTVTGTINLILVGKLGALAIAVVGVSNIIMYNAWALFSGIGHTVNYLVAQNYGANDMKTGVGRTYMALYLCLAAGLFVLLTGAVANDDILRLMGGSGELVASGEGYLRLRFFAMVCSIFAFVFHGFFRGIEDTKTPMVISLAANLAMIFFTYGLTYGKWGFPELGLNGAGWAILLGEAIGLLCCLYVYFIRLHPRYGTRSRVMFDWAESRLILAESGKLGLQEFALSVSMFVFTMFLTRLGTNALAANEVALNVMGFGFMPAFAFGATATLLVGQEVGKGNPFTARRMGTDTAVLGSVFLLLLGLAEFSFAEPVARIYSDDPQVYKLAAELIEVSAFLQVFDGLLNFYAGGLRGIGDTTFLLKTSLVLSWLLFIPLSYLLTFVLGLHSIGAWLSLYIFLMVFGLTMMIRYYRVDWENVQMKSAGRGV
ncbi:MATE family efflux transporter [Effusibacillus pohliae]|uniref:MATE family efflux transporter n=1 Tax=Effusibacillus pohliae TaxID=232270 RepID=UPI0003624CCA|nr:MATE family efflux transporter [Effusibacillus pohliae]